MPAVIPMHVALRSDFTRTAADAFGINQHLETVVAIKTRGSSEVFHGKVDHSQPPWNSGVANMILDLHAWSRSTEAAWRAYAGFSPPNRGGSSVNTLKALQALTSLSERQDDLTVVTARKWLDSWIWRANVVLGETESIKRLPRQPGHQEPKCPWCKKKSLRQKALEGVVFCIDMKCTDDEGKRPMAMLEYFHGDMVLRWQDGIIGAP